MVSVFVEINVNILYVVDTNIVLVDLLIIYFIGECLAISMNSTTVAVLTIALAYQ